MKCWEHDCEAERIKDKPYCKDHKRKNQIEKYKEIGVGTLGFLIGISIFIAVIFFIIASIVFLVGEPNINKETLDNTCSLIYGKNHYFLEQDYDKKQIVCAIKAHPVDKTKEVK